MKSFFNEFVATVRSEARRKSEPRCVESRGKRHVFLGYDWGADTFVFEEGALKAPEGHQPILLVRKADLLKDAPGYAMTFSTGNHAVAALPLMKGQFWNLGRVPGARQNTLMMERVICANLVGGKIDISQRDVPAPLLAGADEWLQGLGFPLDTLVLVERNPETLERYRRQGQEWRVKPLAWTRQEMERETGKSGGKRINSCLRYYHSVKGVHFLSYAAFHPLLALARTDYGECVKALHELVSVTENQRKSYLRMEKFGGHNEVELFGLPRGEALKKWVPDLERLMQDITLGRVRTRQEAVRQLKALDDLFKASLERPQLADETSEDFIETLYAHLTGAVYENESDSGSLSFDSRRTALPGATYWGGRLAFYHPGADSRTRELLSNLDQLVSRNETIEYVNIYELRAQENTRLGEGVTREMEFKTSHRPLCTSWIEKRLKQSRPGYGSYLLARVHAFKALGVNLGEYRLLERMEHDFGGDKHFLRTRCPGDALDGIPPSKYRKLDGTGQGEDPNVVLAMGGLLGDAAAQNLAMKKYIPESKSCRFGEGKEIFEFAYEIDNRREMPVRVGICSVRGALGWPDLSESKDNLQKMFGFYLTSYAEVLAKFWDKHGEVAFGTLVERFFDGFASKTREMHRSYSNRREQFEAFNPKVNVRFTFTEQWRFALWSLNAQEERLDNLKRMFTEKAEAALRAGGSR